MANDDPFEDMGLGELESRNDFLKNQIEGLNKAGRARGGAPGDNKDDEMARDFSQKQIAVEGELYDRLMDQHQSRSETAQIADESKDAEIAPSAMAWSENPDEFDWPGIDTKLE